MTDQAISLLHRRVFDDMAIRKLAPKTHRDYVQRVKDFATFLGRSRGTAKSEEVRGFRGIWRCAVQAQSRLQSRPRLMPFNSSAYADSAFCAEG
jgi:hypothetical protein